MTKRVITGVGIFVLMCIGILFQGWVLRLMLLAAMLTSVFEMYRALRQKGTNPAAWTGYVYCILAVILQTINAAAINFVPSPNSAQGAGIVWLSNFLRTAEFNPQAIALSLGILMGLTAIVARGKVAFDDLVATVLPMLYPGFLFSLILTLQDLPSPMVSTTALMITFFLASINDVFALLIGIKFGKHRLSPEISPKKSIEGSIGGLVASVLFAMLVAWVMNLLYMGKLFGLALNSTVQLDADVLSPFFLLPLFAILGLIAGALSQVGDLVASLIKRHCGVKDYGTIFPGHGGMMDRMDGILFCGAVCYLFFHLFQYAII